MIMIVLVSFALAFIITFATIPILIRQFRRAEIVGIDVNKREKPKIPFLGGLSIIFGFSVAILLMSGIGENFNFNLDPSVAFMIIGVPIISGFIGITDDLIRIPRMVKAVVMLIPAVPLIILHSGVPVISLPFQMTVDLTNISWLYWFVLVPIGITGASNAIGMTDIHNGLATGETVIASFFLIVIAYIMNANEIAILIFGVLIGSSIAFFVFNKYPSKIFLGDTGSLTLGALIAMGAIIGSIEFYGLVCILPTFYELGATVYYKFKGIERRDACINPVILDDGRLKPPEGAERYTLFYYILSKKSMEEKKLVYTVLLLYAICGMIALGLSLAR
jgi:UDP-N-acetylglucosamine--dolichyl-phosphate N-acetylglucosaminephosphotransferase